jgi:mannosyltransferase OCH1-like enzyme
MNIYHSILPPQYVEKKMHPITKENIDKWVKLNPSLIQQVWNNFDCEFFLENFSKNFGKDILKWYKFENQGQYKSDIWRLCVLYEYGGIYADIDQEPLVSLSHYLDFNKYDICLCSNMGLHNISNGFIFTKKESEIIKNSIIELIRRYENNEVIGGTHSMGSVITQMINGNPFEMPLGDKKIGNENCLFLHEIGDRNMKHENQEFYNSFSVYANNDTFKVMNSRYSTYYQDKHRTNEFIKI